MATQPWFEVDKQGLSQLLKRKGMEFILYELVQNAWDTATKSVRVTLAPVDGKPLVDIRVEDDDPDGFDDLRHAFTLYASSTKKADPTKRGRFNLGEKLVLAACERAEIVSTKGGVAFDADGRHTLRRKLDKGSVFQGTIRMTRDELVGVLDASKLLLSPVATYVNGELLPRRDPIRTFEASLPTEIADEEGFLRRAIRKTGVRVYEAGDQAHLYEMGIPVVEIDLPWSVEILQKVPLGTDRDSVTPAFLREVSVLVVNAMHGELTPELAVHPGVQETLGDKRISAEAVESVIAGQFGAKRAVIDPSDPEANSRLFDRGYKMVHGRSFSKDAWKNIRAANAVVPAGTISPTPNPYSDDPDVPKEQLIPEDEWTPGMRGMAAYASELGGRLLGAAVQVRFAKKRRWWAANYGPGCLTFNHGTLGASWFDRGPSATVNDLLVHEFGHHYERNHLAPGYHDALTRLAGKLADLALRDPGFFVGHGYCLGE